MIKQVKIARGQQTWPQRVYERLLEYFGPQGWWPGESPVEIVVGAVLVQNTNWANVEKALDNLKQALLLDFTCLLELELESLAEFIRPSGCYRVKAVRLKNLLTMLNRYQPWLSFFAQDLPPARAQLLQVSGIGQETADSLLLYVGGKATFVADAYSLRVLSRHGLLEARAGYDEVRAFFLERLPADQKVLGEFHALLLALAKTFCRKRQALCAQCPLKEKIFFAPDLA
jgi:endonuclease-3 related protein